MNWEALGAIAESIGAVGVICTLIYLALQVRQNRESLDANTRAMRANLSYQGAISNTDFNTDLIANPDTLHLISKELKKEPPEFTEEELDVLYIANRLTLARTDATYYLYKNGFFDEEYWEARLSWTRWFIARPQVAKWWEMDRRSGNYSPSFISELESAAEDIQSDA